MCDPVTVGISIAATHGAVAGVAAGAAIGAAWGIGANAAMNIATGRGAFENVGKAALFGAVSGGLGTYAKPFADVAAMGGGGLWGSAASYAVTGASPMAIGLSSAAGSLMSAMQPQEYSSEAYDYNPIAYNSIHNQVTGSGGNQASAVLSDEIKKAKAKRVKQAQPKQDSYVNTESFANSGLQLA